MLDRTLLYHDLARRPLEQDMDPESSGSDERLLPGDKEGENHASKHMPVTLHLILYTVTIVTALVVGYTLGWAKTTSGLDGCIRRISKYSPVTKDVPIEYSEQRFNGSLLKQNIFRQYASPEVDAAWESLGVNCKTERHARIDAN